MKFITSSTEFFELHNNPKLIKLRESILAVPINNWKYISTLKFEPAREISKQEAWAITSHQIYLLENFDRISDINRNESLLNRYGYNPVSLTLEGAYLETLESLESLNESLASSVKDFLSMMTEGGTPMGVLHFVLDIIGIIPGSWIGFPSDVVANLLNALIYAFQDKPSYLLAFLNVAFAFSGPIGAGFKTLFKPFMVGGEKLIALIFKGSSSAALRTGVMDFKAGALAIDKGAAAGIIPKFGDLLKGVGTFLLTTGLKIIKTLISIISKTVKLASFGIIDLTKLIPATKFIDELIIKATSAGKAATEAGELLLKEDAQLLAGAERTAAAGSIAAKDAALAAGKDATAAAIEAEKTTKALGNLEGLSAKIEADIMKSTEYKSFMLANPSKSIESLYMKSATTEKLIGGVLNTKSASSIVNLMKDAKISSELVKMGWKPGEAALVNAIKTGDSAVISKLFGEIAENPKIMEQIIAKEPRVAATLSIFKEAPEALISGTKNLKSIQKTIAKLTGGLAYRGITLKALIGFILKQCVKGKCAQSLINGGPDQILSNVSTAATGAATSALMSSMNELLSNVIINEESDPLSEISAADLEEFKTNNPKEYQILSEKMAEAKAAKSQVIKETNPNPCQLDSKVAEAETGAILKWHSAYQEGKVVTNLITPEDWEKSGLNNYTKSFLTLIGEDANIDPQHPISASDPSHIAYLSDVFDHRSGSILINETGTSNLNKTLEQLVEEGALNPSRKEEIREETLKHWENGTVPDSLGLGDLNVDESFFKIGKLITRR
jgi:hypothetical protein